MGEEPESPPSSPEGSPVQQLEVEYSPTNPRLADQCSAFLRAHAGDAIEWRPWGQDAVVEAAENDLPILLSVGFFASYRCHKQSKEIFNNADIAALVNKKYIPVLADRDEFPDIDRMFMAASQIMGATTGGWPLHVLLTPELKPFFCAHYMTRKAFYKMANEMADMWASNGRQFLLNLADATSNQLLATMEPSDVKVKLDMQLFKGFLNKVRTEFDEVSGGFGRPAKFPSVPRLRFLLRMWRRVINDSALKEVLQTMVDSTLKGMCCGGLYDHLAGGFFRCSTDVRWQIPQFEKTLYDNAQLAIVYGEAFQAFGDPVFKAVLRDTLHFMCKTMSAPVGGFYSAVHSVTDTDDGEGSLYVWRYDELRRRLAPEELDAFSEAFGITEWGNFENGTNHLKLENSDEGWQQRSEPSVFAALTALKAARDKRPQASVDDKLVAGWNGLAIHAMALGHRILQGDMPEDASQFLAAAQRAAQQVRSMFLNGTLVRLKWNDTLSDHEGMLEDYALVIQGLLALYQQDFDTQWYDLALELQNTQDEHFSGLGKRYSLSPLQNSPLPPRQDYLDGEVSSAQATSISNLLTLNALSLSQLDPTLATKLLEQVERLLLAVGDNVVKNPVSHAQYLIALDQYMDAQTLAVVTPEPVAESSAKDMLIELGGKYLPHVVFVAQEESSKDSAPPVLKDKELIEGAATVYVLGSEGNTEFCAAADVDSKEVHTALDKPTEIKFD